VARDSGAMRVIRSNGWVSTLSPRDYKYIGRDSSDWTGGCCVPVSEDLDVRMVQELTYQAPLR
jgi:hypothetical protein